MNKARPITNNPCRGLANLSKAPPDNFCADCKIFWKIPQVGQMFNSAAYSFRALHSSLLTLSSSYSLSTTLQESNEPLSLSQKHCFLASLDKAAKNVWALRRSSAYLFRIFDNSSKLAPHFAYWSLFSTF